MLVVSAIDRMGNNVTPSELAMAEDIYSSNLAVILRQLEEEGMVERKTDATDRRKTRVRLTEKGCSVLAESRKRRDDWLAQAFDEALSPEEATHLLKMTPMLNKLADHT
ncbi:MarR family winged helix-turn-helix transcriptional regulator [Klebsiella pneumoniae]|nr:winged helix DNA-binding protein [Klebsiella pneumoniae]MCY0510410.1 winged helix DNA-binding protein [Klebsiella pneumoniae]